MTTRYTTFFGAILGLFVLNLFLYNDVLSIQEMELNMLNFYMRNDPISIIPSTYSAQLITRFFAENTTHHPFMIRFPSVLILIGSLILIYELGSKLFGKSTIQTTIVVCASAWGILFLGKFALIDSWVFCLEIMFFFFTVLYLKQPTLKWKIGFWISVFLSGIIAPFQLLIYGCCLFGILFLFHSEKRRLFQLIPFVVVLPIIAILFFNSTGRLGYFGVHYGNYLIYVVLGLFPFLGFLLAGLTDLSKKIRQKEELSILILAGLMGSLITLSSSSFFFLALLIAKQLTYFTKASYPYNAIIRGASVLVLISSFCVLAYMMLLGFQELGMLGFRTTALLSIVFWIPYFIAIIGVFGKRAIWTEMSLASASMLTAFIFWMQIAPLGFSYFNLEKQVVTQLAKEGQHCDLTFEEQLFDAKYRLIDYYASIDTTKCEKTDRLLKVVFNQTSKPQNELKETETQAKLPIWGLSKRYSIKKNE